MLGARGTRASNQGFRNSKRPKCLGGCYNTISLKCATYIVLVPPLLRGVRGVFVCRDLKEKWYSRRQKAEGRRQKAEGRRQKAEGRRLQAKKIKGFNN